MILFQLLRQVGLPSEREAQALMSEQHCRRPDVVHPTSPFPGRSDLSADFKFRYPSRTRSSPLRQSVLPGRSAKSKGTRARRREGHAPR